MRRLLLLIEAFAISSASLFAKDVTISVIPENAKIFVDGNYQGDGIVTATVKGDFINLKLECPGYVTIHTKFYRSDKRKNVSYTLREDTFYAASEQSDIVNKYFTIPINEKYYSIDDDGKIEDSQVWKMAHQILLNYFDEIESSDQATSFIQTPWVYKSFPDADVQTRVRVTISEGNLSGKLSYRVKVSCETAGMTASHKDENFKPNERLLKKYETLIEEFQTRLGTKTF